VGISRHIQATRTEGDCISAGRLLVFLETNKASEPGPKVPRGSRKESMCFSVDMITTVNAWKDIVLYQRP